MKMYISVMDKQKYPFLAWDMGYSCCPG